MTPADGSPSRDRLARIAAMIEQAEQAVAVSAIGQADDARLIPLFRGEQRLRLRGDDPEAVVDLAG